MGKGALVAPAPVDSKADNDEETNMSKDRMNIVGAPELSEQELMLIQGGGFLGDAVNWVKDKAKDVVDTVKNVVRRPGDAALNVVGGIINVIDWLGRHVKPYPPGPGG
jgi:hypothetical protein